MGHQEIALRLQEFWEGEGCPTIPARGWLPAGGFSPEGFFGVLSDEPFSACQEMSGVDLWLSPYGDDLLHPIIDRRLQVTSQAGSYDHRKRFLESLRALGLDVLVHDVRFVPRSEDRTPSENVCWKVLVDRIEIGSLKRLRNLGGIALREEAQVVEYSLPRLAISLEDGGDAGSSSDRGEQCATYALHCAEPERIGSLFELSAAECEGSLSCGLYRPAYEHALHCIHLDSLLSQREQTSVWERGARIEALISGCAKAYLEAADA